MGADKARLTVDGTALFDRVIAALRASGAREILAIGDERVGLDSVAVRWVPDDEPGEGPLGGVLSALRQASQDMVVVLACDLPDVDPAAVREIVSALNDYPAALAAIPVHDGRLEVLHAAYRRGAAVELSRSFAAGERSLRRAVGYLTLCHPRISSGATFADIDTPDDLFTRTHERR